MSKSADDAPLIPDEPATGADEAASTMTEIETPQLDTLAGIIGEDTVQSILRQVHALFPLSSVRTNRKDLEKIADTIMGKLHTHFSEEGERAARFAREMLDDLIRKELLKACGSTIH